MRISAWVFTVLSAAMWALAITWPDIERRALAVTVGAAALAGALAGACWISDAVRDRDKDALVRAMADFTLQRGQAETVPLPLYRVS